jgi:hypothetical protein
VNRIVDVLEKTLPALIPLVVAIIGATRGPGALRARLKHDAELVKDFPDSDARTALLKLVEDDVEALRHFDSGSRNQSSLALAVAGTVLLGYLAIWLFAREGWWVILGALVGLLATVFLFGIFESAQKVPRDEKGKRIKIGVNDPTL